MERLMTECARTPGTFETHCNWALPGLMERAFPAGIGPAARWRTWRGRAGRCRLFSRLGKDSLAFNFSRCVSLRGCSRADYFTGFERAAHAFFGVSRGQRRPEIVVASNQQHSSDNQTNRAAEQRRRSCDQQTIFVGLVIHVA